MDKQPGLGQNNTTHNGRMCVCIYTVCVYAPTCILFIICEGARVRTSVCVFLEVCARVCSGGALIKSPEETWGLRLFLFPQIKLCVSMPVTYLIWDALLSSPHLAAAHTDSTLLHTSVTLTSPEENDKEEKYRDGEMEKQRMDRNMKCFFVFFIIYLFCILICYLRV